MELPLLLALIILNGIFAMSEIALITARRTQLSRLAAAGDGGAAAALKLHDEPTRFLSTVQIGITSIGILNGIVGEATLAPPLAAWLRDFGLDPDASFILATALVVVIITYATIVVGELVPKRFGQLHPERVARLVARPMHMLAVATGPFVRLLSVSTDTLLRLLGQRGDAIKRVTEEEIRALIQEGTDAGVIEQQEHEMLRNVFRLDDRQIGSLMIPRGDVVYLDIEQSIEKNIERITASEHSRFPVCRGGMHDVIGVVNAKQLLSQRLTGRSSDLAALALPAVFVPETLTGMDLLRHFRSSGAQMVLVVDEYGEVLGLVTLQDVLEAVTGEFSPPGQEDAWAVQRDDGSWLIDGMIPLPELKDTLGLIALPDEDKGRYHTLGGLMMWMLGTLPQTGNSIVWENWRLEVVDLDGKRVDKVLASRVPADT